MNNFKKYLIITFITILPLSILSFPMCSNAQAASKNIMRISPFILKLSLDPGQKSTHEISIQNLLDSPLPVRLTINDFDTKDEEGGFIISQNSDKSIRSWLTLDKTDSILNKGESIKFELSIRVPKEISHGGYQTIVFIEPLSPGNSLGPSVSTKVGIPIFINIGNTEESQAELADLDFPTILLKNELNYFFRVKNNSPYHRSTKPILELKPLFGKSTTFFLDEKVIFPGKTRKWDGAINTNLKYPWPYRAKINISLGDGIQIHQTKTFLFLPILALFVIFFGIILARIVYKRMFIKREFNP